MDRYSEIRVQKAVTRDKIAEGSVGTREIDPEILSQPTTAFGVQAKFQDVDTQLADIAINVRTPPYNARGDGSYDDIQAINDAIATGKPVYFPEPINFYNITDTIVIKFPGQILFSNGRKRGMIRNITNEKQLVVFGDTTINDGAVPQAGIKGLTFYGNPLTVGGIRLDAKSSGNPSWKDASKDCLLQDVAVDYVGNGWALEVYSWCNDIINFTAYIGNKRGALFAKEHNQNNINGLYLTGCAEQSLQLGGDGSGMRGRGNVFNGVVVQQSGGAEGCIVIGDVDNLVINGIYLESNLSKGAPRAIFVKGSARGVVISGVNNLAGQSVIIRNEGVGTFVQDVVSSNVSGVIVENAGTGRMIAAAIEWLPDATATVPKFSDLSTTKTGLFLDTVDGFNKLRVSDYTPSLELIDLSSGAYGWKLYSDGTQTYLQYDAAKDGTYEGTAFRFNASVPELIVDGTVRPETDNTRTLGTGTRRWSTIYAGSGTINTSDKDEKQDFRSIDDALINAFLSIEPKVFRFKDSVELKGDMARYHMGYIAQELRDALDIAGYDPSQYGIWCEDILENGSTRQGIRYDQFIALMEAANRKRFSNIEERLKVLESTL